MRTCAILAALVVAPVLSAEDPKAPVKEIPLKDVKVVFPKKPGGLKMPEVVTSAAQLADSPALKGAADEIKKHVDFDKQKLVFVAWLGSSADKFSTETKTVEGKPVLVFRVVTGNLTDLYKHTRMFVIPKEMSIQGGGG